MTDGQVRYDVGVGAGVRERFWKQPADRSGESAERMSRFGRQPNDGVGEPLEVSEGDIESRDRLDDLGDGGEYVVLIRSAGRKG